MYATMIHMRKLIRAIIRIPILGRAFLIVLRAMKVLKYLRTTFINIFIWLFRSNEITNFTYDLDPTNLRYLASLIADIENIKISEAVAYIRELEEDNALRKHIADMTAKNEFSHFSDSTARYGRRVGWYVFARVLKPKIIMETGIDKGLGSCVLTAALMKNKDEGFEGRYFGTDINPKAGYLLAGDYANFGKILYGDSIQSLESFEGVIDLFINDSDHSEVYEAEEYRTVENKLSEHAILLGDNSHCSDKLLEFSLRTNRRFVFFQEKPLDHWYPGAGIGISFER